jgi:hypothetical protein
MSGIDYRDYRCVIELVEARGLELALEGEIEIGGHIDVSSEASLLKDQLRGAPPLSVLIVEKPLRLFCVL